MFEVPLKFAGKAKVRLPVASWRMMNVICCPVVGFDTELDETFPVSVMSNVGNAKVLASKTGVALKLTTVTPKMSAATSLRAVMDPEPPLAGPARTVFAG